MNQKPVKSIKKQRTYRGYNIDLYKDKSTVPLKFLIQNKDSANLLHFFLLLRDASKNNGGYIPDSHLSTLSHHQRYVLIPQLRDMGWIIGNKLVSVYKLVKYQNTYGLAENSDNVMVSLDNQYLESPLKLKQFILAAVEKYILQGKYNSENKAVIFFYDRESHKYERKQVKRAKSFRTELEFSVQKMGGKDVKKFAYKSQIARSMLSGWGFSEKEVSVLRRGKINSYYYTQSHTHPDFSENCYFSRKKGIYIKKNPTTVVSSKEISLFYVSGYQSNLILNKGGKNQSLSPINTSHLSK